MEQLLKQEFNEIWRLFEGLINTFKLAGEQNFTKENVTPIYAALDYERVEGKYGSLKQRGESILHEAFKAAFPVATLNGIGTGAPLDFSQYDFFLEYIQNQVAMVQKGIFPDLETPIRAKSLTAFTLKHLVGTVIKNQTAEFEVMKQQPQLPVLFPKLLKKNDILVIYDDDGCVPVRFLGYEIHDFGMVEKEALHLEDKYTRQRPPQRQKKCQFEPNLITLYYSLNPIEKSEMWSDDRKGMVHNLVNVYVLIKNPNEPFPEDRYAKPFERVRDQRWYGSV
jgi:hypothetical protein